VDTDHDRHYGTGITAAALLISYGGCSIIPGMKALYKKLEPFYLFS
jgi:hypothetical protein